MKRSKRSYSEQILSCNRALEPVVTEIIFSSSDLPSGFSKPVSTGICCRGRKGNCWIPPCLLRYWSFLFILNIKSTRCGLNFQKRSFLSQQYGHYVIRIPESQVTGVVGLSCNKKVDFCCIYLRGRDLGHHYNRPHHHFSCYLYLPKIWFLTN